MWGKFPGRSKGEFVGAGCARFVFPVLLLRVRAQRARPSWTGCRQPDPLQGDDLIRLMEHVCPCNTCWFPFSLILPRVCVVMISSPKSCGVCAWNALICQSRLSSPPVPPRAAQLSLYIKCLSVCCSLHGDIIPELINCVAVLLSSSLLDSVEYFFLGPAPCLRSQLPLDSLHICVSQWVVCYGQSCQKVRMVCWLWRDPL